MSDLIGESETTNNVPVEAKADVAAKTPENEKSQEKQICKISLDTSLDDMLKWDEEGRKLFFETDNGKFKRLSEKDVRKLSAKNKESYLMALLANQRESEAKPSEGLQIRPEYAMASDRLGFEYPPEFLAKFHPCLKRPDELGKAYRDGYTHVTAKDGVIGFGVSDDKGNIFVGTAGRVEQYLLKIPKEIADARLKAVGERSRGFIGAVDSQTEEKLERLGGKPFTPKERDEYKWKGLGEAKQTGG
jgi:hypothetical protein